MLGPFESHAKHFGLQLILHAIKFRWDQCEGAGHEEIKRMVLRLAEQGAAGRVEDEKHFVLVKIATVGGTFVVMKSHNYG